MARSLRKHTLDGTPYFRRDKVEAEIEALAGISAAELERRADLWQVSKGSRMAESTLNATGQATVPALIRRRFKAALGTRLAWSVLSDGTLVLPKTKRLQDLAGILDAPGNVRAGIDDLSR